MVTFLFQKLGALKIGEEPSEYKVFLSEFKEKCKEQYEIIIKKYSK